MIEELNYTDEMEDWFDERTNKHIERVKKYAKLIEKYDPETYKGLVERTEKHDESKFEEPERTPYIFVSWDYHMKDQGKKFEVPQDVKDKMTQATKHHVKSNKHHPESWTEQEGELINRENRDKPPKEIVDATKMDDISIGEMVADWMAMSEEKGNTVKEWADKNVNIRWKFTDKQKDMIYDLINNIKKDSEN